jgi:hypothetical protein
MDRLQSHQIALEALALLVIVFCSFTVFAQDPQVPHAPPPLKLLAPQDRAVLDQTKDTKSRVKRTIELAETHLVQAEMQTQNGQFIAASAELGKYWALIEDVFRLLAPLNRDSTKTRDMYKRVEISLRAHGIRLTLIRRTTPAEYAVWIKQLEEYARNGRTEALNSFYGHTVVRDNAPKPRNESAEEKRAADVTKPPEKQP